MEISEESRRFRSWSYLLTRVYPMMRSRDGLGDCTRLRSVLLLPAIVDITDKIERVFILIKRS